MVRNGKRPPASAGLCIHLQEQSKRSSCKPAFLKLPIFRLREPRLLLHPHDVGAQRRKLLFNVLIASVNILDAGQGALPLRRQRQYGQRRAAAQIERLHRRAAQSAAPCNLQNAAEAACLRAKPLKSGTAGKTILKHAIFNAAAAGRCRQHGRQQRRTVGGKAGKGAGTNRLIRRSEAAAAPHIQPVLL